MAGCGGVQAVAGANRDHLDAHARRTSHPPEYGVVARGRDAGLVAEEPDLGRPRCRRGPHDQDSPLQGHRLGLHGEALAVMRAQAIGPVDLPGSPVRLLALGLRLAPLFLLQRILLPIAAGGRGDKPPSLLVDICNGKTQSEIDELNGAIVRAGKARGVKTPVNAAFVGIVHDLLEGKADRAQWRRVVGPPLAVGRDARRLREVGLPPLAVRVRARHATGGAQQAVHHQVRIAPDRRCEVGVVLESQAEVAGVVRAVARLAQRAPTLFPARSKPTNAWSFLPPIGKRHAPNA